MSEPKFKIIFAREDPQFGEGSTVSMELETSLNLKELSEVFGKKDEEGLVEIRIIKLPEKSQNAFQ